MAGGPAEHAALLAARGHLLPAAPLPGVHLPYISRTSPVHLPHISLGKLCIFQRHLFEQRQLSARANNLAAAGGTEEAPAKGDNNLAAAAAAAAAATATAAAAAATTNVAAKAPVKPARPKVR